MLIWKISHCGSISPIHFDERYFSLYLPPYGFSRHSATFTQPKKQISSITVNTGQTWSGVWSEYGSSDAYGNWVAFGKASVSITLSGGVKNCFPNKAAPKCANTAICATCRLR